MAGQTLGKNTVQEILSQPQVWEKTLQRLSGLDRKAFPRFADYDVIIFTGCGSTYYQSLWAARMCEIQTGVICRAVPASDLILHPNAWFPPNRKCLLIAVSRSAETSETLRAVSEFQSEKKGDVIVVTCYPEKELATRTPWVVGVPDSKEVSVAQTRSFTSMMLGVIWLVMGSIPTEIPGLVARASTVLLDQFSSYAKEIGYASQVNKFFFLGSGPLYGLACEAMLKMKEMSMSHSEAYHVMEFRHGPMSIVDQSSLVIGLLTKQTLEREALVIKEMRKRGAWTLGICDEEIENEQDAFQKLIVLPKQIFEWIYPLYLPVLQLIAYERSVAKGLDPDHPTNLSSVVVLNE